MQVVFIYIHPFHVTLVKRFGFHSCIFTPERLEFLFFPSFENWLLSMMPPPAWTHALLSPRPVHASPAVISGNNDERETKGITNTCSSTTWQQFQVSSLKPNSLPKRLFFKLKHHPTF